MDKSNEIVNKLEHENVDDNKIWLGNLNNTMDDDSSDDSTQSKGKNSLKMQGKVTASKRKYSSLESSDGENITKRKKSSPSQKSTSLG